MRHKLIMLICILACLFPCYVHAGSVSDNRGYGRNGRLEEYDKAAQGANSAGIDKRGYYRDPEYRYELKSGMSQEEWEAKQAARDKMQQWEYEHRDELEQKAQLRRKREEAERARLQEERRQWKELNRQWLEKEARLHQEELKRRQEEERLKREQEKKQLLEDFKQEMKFFAVFVACAGVFLVGMEYYKKRQN